MGKVQFRLTQCWAEPDDCGLVSFTLGTFSHNSVLDHAMVRYDAMCQAIAAAYDVDEVKQIRDQALALQMYAQQARNLQAERQAWVIRIRAERRLGELLQGMEGEGGAREPIHWTGRSVRPVQNARGSRHQQEPEQPLAAVG